MQIEFGGYSDNFRNLNDVVDRFVPDYHKGQSKGGDIGGMKRFLYFVFTLNIKTILFAMNYVFIYNVHRDLSLFISRNVIQI